MKNVVLHGVVEKSKLASELKKMDAFLICYDIDKDPSNANQLSQSIGVLSYRQSNSVKQHHDICQYA